MAGPQVGHEGNANVRRIFDIMKDNRRCLHGQTTIKFEIQAAMGANCQTPGHSGQEDKGVDFEKPPNKTNRKGVKEKEVPEFKTLIC